MRILLVSHYVLPHYGGIEVVVENLARGFTERGHEVKVLSSRIAGPAREERNGFEIIRVPAWNFLERYAVPYPLFSPRLVAEVRRLVVWADIVHAHGFLYQPTLVALWLAKRAGRPRVLTEYAGFVRYNDWFWNVIQSFAIHTLGRLSIRLADAVAVIGTRAFTMIQQLTSPDKPLRLIPTAVDTGVFQPLSLEEKRRIRQNLGWDERPKVLSAGRLVPRKGIELLMDVLDDRYEIVLCGRGDMPLPNRPGLLVYRSPDDVLLRRIYQGADLYVLAAHSEGGFPLTAQEAMACGLPVIAFFDPIYLTYVDEKVVRFIQPSASALQEAILDLLADERKRQHLGLLSLEWARSHFSWERVIEEYLQLYNQFLIMEARHER